MPATPYTELSVAATPYFEGIASPDTVNGFYMGDMVIPLDAAAIYLDLSVPYTELSIPLTPQTELTAPLTNYTEMSI